jgi:hypothetical protein
MKQKPKLVHDPDGTFWPRLFLVIVLGIILALAFWTALALIIGS